MTYHITHHARQRRAHHPITPKDKIIEMMERLRKYQDFMKFEDGFYKFARSSHAIVIKVDHAQERVTVITQRGLTHKTPQAQEAILARLKLTKQTQRGKSLYRDNYLGRRVKMGSVLTPELSGEDSYTLILNKGLHKKFDFEALGIEAYETCFESFEELAKYISEIQEGYLFDSTLLESIRQNS